MRKHKTYNLYGANLSYIHDKIRSIPGMNPLCMLGLGDRSTVSYSYDSGKINGRVHAEGPTWDRGKVTIDIRADFKEQLEEICSKLNENGIHNASILDTPLSELVNRLWPPKK